MQPDSRQVIAHTKMYAGPYELTAWHATHDQFSWPKWQVDTTVTRLAVSFFHQNSYNIISGNQ